MSDDTSTTQTAAEAGYASFRRHQTQLAAEREVEVRLMLLDYEIRGAGWPHYVFWPWLQQIVARYFVAKVNRKLRRQKQSHAMRKTVAALKEQDG